MHTSGIDRGCRIVIVRGGRYDIHPSAVIAIAGVASHHGAIRRGFFTDHDTRTTLREDMAEYKRRSPVWHAEKLQDPLLIHTNTSDDDVNVVEVEHMIRALKAEGKKFDYKIFDRAPGAHSFDRTDTKQASEI